LQQPKATVVISSQQRRERMVCRALNAKTSTDLLRRIHGFFISCKLTANAQTPAHPSNLPPKRVKMGGGAAQRRRIKNFEKANVSLHKAAVSSFRAWHKTLDAV
jgi:hypothetical protein